MRTWMVAVSGVAGCGGMHSAKDAPFDLNPKSGLWATVDIGDEAVFGAILVLSNDKLDCSAIEGKSYEDALQAVIAKGQGLGMTLDASAEQGSVVGDPTGMWTETGATALEEPYAQDRYFTVFGWSDGFAFGTSGAYGGWLELDEVGDKVTGEFRTEWWWGPIRAEACAPLEGLGTTTTTYDYTSSR